MEMKPELLFPNVLKVLSLISLKFKIINFKAGPWDEKVT